MLITTCTYIAGYCYGSNQTSSLMLCLKFIETQGSQIFEVSARWERWKCEASILKLSTEGDVEEVYEGDALG